MFRPIALAASIAISIAALACLDSTLPAEAQTFRGNVATATLGMQCLPDKPVSQPGNIIILATGRQVVPQGTLVTVAYMEPTATINWFGKPTVLGWAEKTTVYKTKHTMYNSDPEVVGVRGYCLSATYVSDQPVLAQ